MRSRLIVMSLLLSALCAKAQDAPAAIPITLEQELSRLATIAQTLQHDLPNFTCKQTSVSQLRKKDQVKQEVRFAANIRVQRGSDGVLDEHLDYTELNGSPYAGPEPRTPLFVVGGFDEALLYFLAGTQPDFDFTLGPGRIDFVHKHGTKPQSSFLIPPSTRGFLLFDESGNPTYIERRTDPSEANKAHLTDYVSYRFQMVEMNGRRYPLTTQNLAESSRGNEIRRFEVTFSDCRFFHATSKIVPGITQVPEPAPQSEPHP